MPPPEDVTLGELNRKLDGLAGSVQKLTDKLDDYPKWSDIKRIEGNLKDTITAAVEQREAVIKAVEHRVMTLESWQTWAARIVIGAVVTGVIAAFFIFKP